MDIELYYRYANWSFPRAGGGGNYNLINCRKEWNVVGHLWNTSSMPDGHGNTTQQILYIWSSSSQQKHPHYSLDKQTIKYIIQISIYLTKIYIYMPEMVTGGREHCLNQHIDDDEYNYLSTDDVHLNGKFLRMIMQQLIMIMITLDLRAQWDEKNKIANWLTIKRSFSCISFSLFTS